MQCWQVVLCVATNCCRLMPYAICALCFYCIGYPVLVFFILYKNHMRIMEDQLLRAEDLGKTRLENPNCYDLRKMFHKYVCACVVFCDFDVHALAVAQAVLPLPA